jgi:hypothetical protein
MGFHTVIPFQTTVDGTFHFRFHADYGKGGYIGINDGSSLSNVIAGAASNSATDIWGHVEVNDVALTAGMHYFEGLGFEGCCDGHAELDDKMPTRSDWIRVVTGASSDFVCSTCGGAPRMLGGDGILLSLS